MSLPDKIHQFVLKRHAADNEGIIDDQFTFQELPAPALGEGDVALKVTHLSCDPTQRGWINPFPGYMPNVQIGEVMRAGGFGVVVESKAPGWHKGDVFTGLIGWRDWYSIRTFHNYLIVLI